MKLLQLALFIALALNTSFSITSAQVTKYVEPGAIKNGNGSISNPYNSIKKGVETVNKQGGGTLIIKDGDYDMGEAKVSIKTAASSKKQLQ